MKTGILTAITAIILSGCNNSTQKADAYGNFDATEVVVSAETSGRVIRMGISEGSEAGKGSTIAIIDTAILHLQENELDATIRSIRAKLAATDAQNEILTQQIANISRDLKRIENMLKDDAATRKQYDDLTGQIDVLKKQIAANNIQKSSITAEAGVYQSKKATLEEMIARSTVRSPLNGTVLEKYVEEGETVTAGKPLVKISDLSEIKLKVYISGADLSKVRIGNECTVRIDDGKKGFKSFKGKVSNVSDKAEFTPKIIQTKEERVVLVYAVTILVPNDGSMKSGMPGEAIF